MAASSSPLRAVVAALAANAAVTLLKLIAFAVSGSGAMLSEAIHSAADTGNQVLLFLGLRRSGRDADERFHYGYGGDRFIFGMLSASGIFFVGAGVTIYNGVTGLLHPHMPTLGPLTFIVLALSFAIEGGVLVYAVRSVWRQRGDQPFLRYVRRGADPAAVAILLEDSAAVSGLLLAGLGITLSYVTGDPTWDSVGSLVVGVALGVIAIHLVLENRTLLLGQAVPEGVEDRFVAVLFAQRSLRDVRDVKTRQLTPDVYQLKAEIAFDHAFMAERLDPLLPQPLTAGDDAARAILLDALAARAVHAVASEIASIERAVRAVIPQARHIDLEVAHPPEHDAPSPEASRAIAVISPGGPPEAR